MKRRNFCFAAFMITFAILCARSLEGQNLLQKVPVDATAVAANLTVTNATGAGHFVVYAAGTPQPSTSTLNFSSRQTRANNAILTLGVSGQIKVFCTLPFGGTADLVLDVAGYFQ